MPIPTVISDLSVTAGDNYPAGSDVIGNGLDNLLRAHASFIRQPYALASSSIAAGSTVDVSASDAESVLITGADTITSLGSGFVGCKRELRFDDACTLTHSDNLQLPGGNDITTADGDIYVFRCTASGVWAFVSGASVGTSGGGGIPQFTMAADKTLALTDGNKHCLRTGGNLTIPPNSSVAFDIGTAVTVVNDAATSMTLTRGSGVTLRMATSSTDANRTLAARGIATLLKVATNTWYVTGAGVS
jgi:hypothetical protein